MKSRIYEGTIRHRRFHPRQNSFKYRIFFMYLDLAELPTLFDGRHPFWSYEQPNLAFFRRRDHFGDPADSMNRAVRDLVARRLGQAPAGPIRMLTHLRYFGHCFNPATFYYCYDAADTRVETIIVEINNTPWNERHCYVLGSGQNEHTAKEWRRFRFDKTFHVSPFIGMNIRYDWRFRVPGETIRVHMIDYENEVKLFDASLALQRRPITRRELTRVLLNYPVLTVKVLSLIYFQSLKLYLKKVPVFSHP